MSIPFGTPRPPRPAIDIGMDRCYTILRALGLGWTRARAASPIDTEWDEVSITECLREGMREAVRTLGPPRASDVWVWPGAESRSAPATPKPDGRTDIPIAFTSIREKLNEHDAHAIIECKRVAEDAASLCRAYVDRGIRRFMRGSKANPQYPKYAANHAVGFMAGYLLRGTVAGAAKRINSYLDGPEHLGPPRILQEDWLRTSTHERQAPLQPVTLHHAFLAIQGNCLRPRGNTQ